jgi:heme-degrading monooxygenase HmoA
MTLAATPDPPYYAVIFSSVRTEADAAEYAAMAARMDALAAAQPGYLGMESARDGVGITVSYWRDLASIAAWKRHADHLMAQQLSRARWYRDYRVRVAKVERAYGL